MLLRQLQVLKMHNNKYRNGPSMSIWGDYNRKEKLETIYPVNIIKS